MSRTLASGKVSTAMTIANARQRAIAEGIEVRQVDGSSLWIASSGTDPQKAYVLNIIGGNVKNCTCRAGEFGAYCKHRAAWELAREAREESNV
ncbi:MAG: SWIM zinc finger family protein [Rhodocyclaceae bacterium]|nr:SWIM zinc finger family protein [Rhodocyclaceae bacterium]